MSNRLEITEDITEIDIFNLEGDLEAVIQRLVESRNPLYKRIFNRIHLDDDGDGPYGYLTIRGVRDETDEEIAERTAKEARNELQKIVKQQEEIAKEKKLYLELKEKYKDLA